MISLHHVLQLLYSLEQALPFCHPVQTRFPEPDQHFVQSPGQPIPSMIITCVEPEVQPLSYQAGTASLTVGITHASLGIYGCQGTSITSTIVRFDLGIRYPGSDPDTNPSVPGFLTRVILAPIRR